jgi:hypothetical protein
MADGFHDINDLIPGGISSDGWITLNNMATKNRSGWIAGSGTRATSPFPHLPYLLRPAINAGLPGDYNNNGEVDTADYVLWRNGGPLMNEVDNPGVVNAADYTEWRARFGNPTPGSSAGSHVAVPEPASSAFVLIALSMACTAAARCQRHR